MIDRYTRTRLAILAAALVAQAMIDASTPIAAQTLSPPAQSARAGSTDVSAALLAEVRALRSEVADSARGSLRAQLLVARVQLQEQRIIYFDRRRAEGAAKVTEAAERTRQVSERTRSLDDAVRNITTLRPTAELTAQQLGLQRAELEATLRATQTELDAAREEEQRLRREQSDVEAALATEQGRWNDFNARLDELERSLPK